MVGGFLDGGELRFTTGLNCLIGPRGTGKTTALEFIRYALDAFPESEYGAALRKSVEALVKGNLGGGRIRVAVETGDGLEYVVNRFIFTAVVQRIREVKPKRQLIFVTHNPNIPVLGDAEKVFVLRSSGTQAELATEGTVDQCKTEIVTLLEGGEEAFRERKKRYAY